jgi:hypothetical protein
MREKVHFFGGVVAADEEAVIDEAFEEFRIEVRAAIPSDCRQCMLCKWGPCLPARCVIGEGAGLQELSCGHQSSRAGAPKTPAASWAAAASADQDRSVARALSAAA